MERKEDKRNLDTKNKIVKGFKKLALKKPINKITISELTNFCNINRNTFYYHFEDIRTLMEWILSTEITNILDNIDIRNTKELLYSIFDYVEKNEKLLESVYFSFGREKFRKLLYPYFYNTLNNLIIENKLTNNIYNNDFKDFVINFYSDGIAFTILDYIKKDKKEKEKIINYLLLMNKNINLIINNYK